MIMIMIITRIQLHPRLDLITNAKVILFVYYAFKPKLVDGF